MCVHAHPAPCLHIDFPYAHAAICDAHGTLASQFCTRSRVIHFALLCDGCIRPQQGKGLQIEQANPIGQLKGWRQALPCALSSQRFSVPVAPDRDAGFPRFIVLQVWWRHIPTGEIRTSDKLT